MGCGVYWWKIQRVEEDMATLRRLTVEPSHPAYQALYRQRGELMGNVGRKLPRRTIAMVYEWVVSRLRTLGLLFASASPGFTIEELKDAIIKVWWDDEMGFMTEARFKPKSPPIYNSISAEDAAAFIKGEETGEQIATAFHEDEYYGE